MITLIVELVTRVDMAESVKTLASVKSCSTPISHDHRSTVVVKMWI